MMIASLEEIGENPYKIQVEAWRVWKEAIYGPYIIIVSKNAVYLVPSLNIRVVPKRKIHRYPLNDARRLRRSKLRL